MEPFLGQLQAASKSSFLDSCFYKLINGSTYQRHIFVVFNDMRLIRNHIAPKLFVGNNEYHYLKYHEVSNPEIIMNLGPSKLSYVNL